MGAGRETRGDARSHAGARDGDAGLAIEAPAGLGFPVAAGEVLSGKEEDLEQGAHELAGEPEARLSGAAPGIRGDDVGGAPGAGTSGALGGGDPRCGPGLVAGRGGRGIDGDARPGSDLGRDVPGRDRRPLALPNATTADGLSRDGAVGRVERGYDQA